MKGTTTCGNALCVKDGRAKERTAAWKSREATADKSYADPETLANLSTENAQNHGPIKTTTASMDIIDETDLEKAMRAIEFYQDVWRSLLLNFWKFE